LIEISLRETVLYYAKRCPPTRKSGCRADADTAHFHGGPWDRKIQDHLGDTPPVEIRVPPDTAYVGTSGLPFEIEDGEPIAMPTNTHYVLRDRSSTNEP